MAQAMFLSFSCLLALACLLQGTNAVSYRVTNKAASTPGGIKFTNQIGNSYALQTLSSSTNFIWRVFQQNTEANRKNVQEVSLFIDDMGGVAYTSGNQIHASARYINNYNGDIRKEITGVLYHEMAHVWQWSNNAPGGLIEGVADFVRLKAGFAPSHWVKPGQGNKWNQGYDVTARFLDYCDGLRNGFVAELNKKMRNGYSDNFFVELLGKTVDQLWSEYKGKYQS